MAATSRTIRVIFDGTTAGLAAAATRAERIIRAIDDRTSAFNRTLNQANGLTRFTGGVLKMAAGVGAGAATILTAVQASAALVSIIGTLTPGLLALPGIALGAAAAFGVFKIATLGVADALKGDAEALAKLAPNARDAVNAITALKSEFDLLRRAVQTDFFSGFADQIKQTATVYFPILRATLPGIAQGMNEIAQRGFEAARTPFFTGAVTSILQNTSLGLANMRNVLANVLTGFVGLGTVGASYLPKIGTAIDGVAARFRAWVEEGLASGRIQQFVAEAITALRQLGAIASDIGAIFKSVFSGLGLSGADGILASIQQTTAAVREFMATAEAQTSLRSLGDTIKVVGVAFRDVLLTALRELAPVLTAAAPFLQQFAITLGGAIVSALRIAGPLLQQLATFLSNNAAAASVVATVLVGVGVALKAVAVGAKVISGISAAFSALSSVLGPIIGVVRNIGSGIAALIGVLGGFKGIWAAIVRVVVTAGAAIAGAISAPVAICAAVVAAIVGLFVLLYNKVEGFRTFVDGVVSAVGTGISTAFNAVKDFISSIDISAIASSIGEFFSSLPAKAGAALSAVGTFLSELPGKVGTALATGGQAVLTFFTNLPMQIAVALGTLVGFMARIAVDAWNAFYLATTTAVTTVVTFVTQLPTMIGNALLSLVTFLGTTATNAWNAFKTATSAGISAVVSFVSQLPGRIVSAISSLMGLIGNIATQAWNGFKNITSSLITATLSFVQQLPGRISSALSALPGQLTSLATRAWNAFKSAVSSGTSALISFVGTIPGRVVSTLSGLVGQMTSLGGRIIDGLISGARAAAGRLFSYMRELASSAFNAAKSAFAVNSPSKLFMPLGVGIPEGLRAGVLKALPAFLQILGVVADRAANAFGVTLPTFAAPTNSVRLLGGSIPAPADQRLTLVEALGEQLRVALGDLPPTNISLRTSIGEQGLDNFVKTTIENADRETVRTVSAGAGQGF